PDRRRPTLNPESAERAAAPPKTTTPLLMKKNASNQSGFLHARAVVASALVATAMLLGLLSFASTPGTSSITVPTAPNQTVTVTWTGMIPPGANGASDCTNLAGTPLADQHLPTINVPPDVYNNVNAKFT